jgi:copper(I)-binding protein
MNTARRSALPARALALSAAVVLGGALVTGCGSSSSGAASSGSAAAATSSPSSTAALALTDPWVKAQPQNMTGFFGVLKNNTDKDVTIVSGTSSVSEMVEMHEMAMVDGTMKMRKKDGGFVVPAHGSLELKPGSFHVMLMGLKTPIVAGQSVNLTLKTADGQEITATGVGKTIAGGNESYAPGGSMSPGMSGSASMSMSASS